MSKIATGLWPRLRAARKGGPRRGAIAVLAALLVVFLICIMAFAIDISYITNTRSELRRSVDAGALAGAGGLAEGQAMAIREAERLVSLNEVAGRALEDDEVEVEVGRWDEPRRVFVPDTAQPYAVRVAGTRRETPLFFARALGFNSLDVSANAVAVSQPRDIMLVLDYSASMNDDSELQQVPSFGLATIEENLYTIYQELGSPEFGNMQWRPVPINSNIPTTVKTLLGLHNVPYPYPQGSWDDYIHYSIYDSDNYAGGFRRKYGYLTLVNYWLKMRPRHDETPDLWMTSEQPITALKNSVTLFLEYLRTPDLDDRVGLTAYTSRDETALVECGLTHDFDAIDEISRHRQAGHYHIQTNIGDGIRVGKEELLRTARPESLKLIVLMTDGIANLPTGRNATQYAEQQAQAAADAGISILTISLGALADRNLMERIARMADGIHFNIPGGRRIEDVEEDLVEAFRQIARHRPLKLVQ